MTGALLLWYLPMTDERFDYIAADVRYIREKVDKIAERVTRLEVKAALWGGGVAAVVALAAKVLE